jgi:hypothetical protein
MRKAKAAPKTTRKKRGGKGVLGTFGPNFNQGQQETAIRNVVEGYNN